MKHGAYINGLDKLDLKIIAALHRSGRITKLQLSEEVGLSATPCWERIKKLEKSGFINSYHADVDLNKLLGVSYYRVEIKIINFSVTSTKNFEKIIIGMPEIVECDAVMGNIDYVLKVVARNVEEYQQVIDKILTISQLEIDYLTYPVSRLVKTPKELDLLAVCDAFISPLNGTR